MGSERIGFKTWLRGALRSNTVRLALLQGLVGVLAMPVITPAGAAVVLAKSALDIAVRSVTKKSLEEKANQPPPAANQE